MISFKVNTSFILVLVNIVNNLQRLRIGYSVFKEGGKCDFGILKNDFSRDSYNELQSYSKIIYDLQPIALLFDAVRINFNDLNADINKEITIINTVELGKEIVFKNLVLMSKLLVRITNFITSANSFLTHTELILKKISEDDGWNNFRNDLHKNSFSYRFVYELRNYSQHHSLPISSLNINVDIPTGNAKLIVKMKRDELLNSGYKWGKYKKDLESCNEEFDLYPHLVDYMKIIEKLLFKCTEVKKIQIQECVDYFNRLNSAFNFPSNSVPVVFIGESEGNNVVPANNQPIPFDNLDWLMSTLKK